MNGPHCTILHRIILSLVIDHQPSLEAGRNPCWLVQMRRHWCSKFNRGNWMSVRSLLHRRFDDEKPNLQIHWPVAPTRPSIKYYGFRISLLGSYHLFPMNSIDIILQITSVGLFCVSIAFGSCGLLQLDCQGLQVPNDTSRSIQLLTC
jgi:hypothetical protein